MKLITKAIFGITLATCTLAASAQAKDPKVGGAEMFPTKTIVENAAGLVDTLSGKGPFTVFAPTDDAFAKLPAGTVDTLLKPENKATLSKILTYHVVPGRVSSKQLVRLIKKGGGKAELTTVEGGKLTASLSGGKVILTDEKGGTSTVTTANVFQSNGVIHVVDTVLMPN